MSAHEWDMELGQCKLCGCSVLSTLALRPCTYDPILEAVREELDREHVLDVLDWTS